MSSSLAESVRLSPERPCAVKNSQGISLSGFGVPLPQASREPPLKSSLAFASRGLLKAVIRICPPSMLTVPT